MAESGSKKKIVITAVASVLLVAAVVAVAITTRRSGSDGTPDVASTAKAVDTLCSPTQYIDTCKKSLQGANTTDPKALIGMAINVAVKSVGDAMGNTTVLKDAAADPMTKGAFQVCEDVLQRAIDDLRRTVDQVGEIDPTKVREYVADLRTWLSAVVTNQDTCIDAFATTSGDTGEKMKNLLKTARELSSNGLAMVTDIAESVGDLQIGNADSGRKLATEEAEEFVSRRVLQATTLSMRSTILVAKDGSGQFKTINDAINSLPKKNNDSFIIIHLREGVYDEQVIIPKGLNKIFLVGDGPTKSRITGNKSVAGGVETYYTPSLIINGEDFLLKDIGVENTAGTEGYQAVAVRVSGDRAILYNVNMDGYQDTLCADTHRQYYSNCTISGTIDYVFGNGLALLQNCTFITRKPAPKQGCIVTAQGRSDPKSNTAIIIQNGHFTATQELLDTTPKVEVYLGRPWKELSRTIIMQSNIEGIIDPAGWAIWEGKFGLDTCYYAEEQNRGAGSDTTARVTWKGIHKLSPDEVKSWTGEVMFGGDQWIRDSGVPYTPAMMQV